jgi:cysteine synthase A
VKAAKDFHQYLQSETTATMCEPTYYGPKQIHNLKYFTWIEKQGKDLAKQIAQWCDFPDYWDRIYRPVQEIDHLIEQFNERRVEGVGEP